MDFDAAKENIQPLACGRNVHMLHASLHTDTHELMEQRRRLEKEIQDYAGDDPLEAWYHYIDWIEQSYPSGGKESGLQEVLVKCLTCFEKETKYYQDERMVKLYIKFINSLKEPLEKYEALYKAGIGTMVADFYISWAYVADLCGNSRKADEIFVHGIKCNAKPKDVLEEAHLHFRFYVGQRMMYKDNEEVQDEANRQLSERRLALSSLRRHGKKATVGSIRTGAAVKSHMPGIVLTTSAGSSKNVPPKSKVFEDENIDPNAIREIPMAEEENPSAVRMLIDAARNQENEIEPGPWDKAHIKNKLFGRNTKHSQLNFEIHEDSTSEIKLPKVEIAAFKYPPNFVAKNQPQKAWVEPITTEEQANHSCLPNYNKCLVYPRTNKEFQLEELCLYYRYKRRGIENAFTAARDPYWSKGDVNAPLRLYPNFAKRNLPQKLDALDTYHQPNNLVGLKTCAKKIYNADLQQEFQLEEIMWQKRQQRMMNIHFSNEAMEETMCANSELVAQRKSLFPVVNRKSIFPTAVTEENNVSPKPSGIVATFLQDSVEDVKVTPKPSGIVATLLQDSAQGVKLQEAESNEFKQVVEEKDKFLPFEIYEDTTQPKMLVRTSKHNDTPRFASAHVDAENIEPTKSTFKAPLPPQPLPSNIVSATNDPPLQIYTDKPNSAVSSSTGYYDGEETCCTQQFNMLLKSADKMSTPVTQKVVSRVALNPIPLPLAIKEVVEEEEKVAETASSVITSPQMDANLPETSPQQYCKNLSTILETSEHGSSHTTAASRATTKSSCLSNIESESTPAIPRLQSKLKAREVLEENVEIEMLNIPEKVGNFTRLEERENTAQLCGSLSTLRFQEDKTENLTNKLVIPAGNKSTKFQEDKTETFTKLLKPAANVARGTGFFQEDKTDTFSKLLPPPMLPTEKTPKKMPTSPLMNFATPDLVIASPGKSKKNNSKYKDNSLSNLNSTANLLRKDSLLPMPNTTPKTSATKEPITPSFKFRDSFMPDLLFVPETQKTEEQSEKQGNNSQAAGGNNFWKSDYSINKNESLLPNLSIAERWARNSSQTKEPEVQKIVQNKHMLPDSFLKDFHMPPPMPMESKVTFANASTLKFLNESVKTTATAQQTNQSTIQRDLVSFGNTSNIKFLDDIQKTSQHNKQNNESLPKVNYFEGNLETAQFNVNNSMIKNSTCLVPNMDCVEIVQQSPDFIMEQSVHIKQEVSLEDKNEQIVDELSIYYKKTPRTPKETHHTWMSGIKTPKDNEYVHPIVDLDATHHIIQKQCADQLLNPFSEELRNAFLDDITFTEYISTLPNCELKRHISKLHAKQQIEIKNQKFEVIKLIAEGGFGSVYQGKQLTKGTKIALKQEQPPKLWEYYICLEIQSRIKVDDMLLAYMSIDWALIGSNSSIFVYGFSAHGSLIHVCNKVRKITNKHVDEFVVMFMARELFEIIDHLHAVNIIHADLKPDNILLIQFLNYKNETRSMQLIDFGESIDMRLFQNPQQEFKYVYNKDQLKCVEMREGRPWTYQLDLFGICGVIHALLFGKYMEVEKRSNGIWMPKIRMPRYFHKDLWENIFETLLNVKDSQTMPDLQTLRKELKEVLVANEQQVLQKLTEFNFNLRC